MNRITADMLTERYACSEQIDEFRDRFPDGVTFKSEDDAIAQCLAVSDVFDWNWAADAFLDAPARKAYEEATAPARKAHEGAKAPAWKAYDEANATAFARAFWKVEA